MKLQRNGTNHSTNRLEGLSYPNWKDRWAGTKCRVLTPRPRETTIPAFTGMRAAINVVTSRCKDFRLACLTNMNAAYWYRIRDDMGLGRHFDRCFASHEIGLLKPDRRIYEHVVAQLECRPEAIVFFDDTMKNVEGLEALKEKLRDLGIIKQRAG